MTRLSDFVWNTKTRPSAVTKANSIVLALHHPPGRNADVIQSMQHNNEDLIVTGTIYDQSGSTREQQRDGLMKTFYQLYPISFIDDLNSTFGLSGDAYTEATTSWSAANCTVTADATYYKIGTKSLAVTGLGGSNEVLTSPSWTAMNCNLPYQSSLCFWLRVPAVTTANNITVRIITTAGNYYSRIIDLDDYLGGWTAATWKECVIPLGSAISGWTTTGTPDWESTTAVAFAWVGAASDTVYIDGLCIAYGVRFDSLSSFLELGGSPNRYDYEFNLVQYKG